MQLPAERFSIRRLAFPDHVHPPPKSLKLQGNTAVSLGVARKLGTPVVQPRPGRACTTAARMLMPEAAMDEHDLPLPGEHDVRSAGQVAAMQTEAVAKAVGNAPHRHLRRGVLAAYPRHQSAAPLRRDPVHGPLLGPNRRLWVAGDQGIVCT